MEKVLKTTMKKTPLSNFRYVFSTGNYIDSLIVKGSVVDAFNREISEKVKIYAVYMKLIHYLQTQSSTKKSLNMLVK